MSFSYLFRWFAILSLCGVPWVLAEVQTFERDYTYKASENDSRVSARQAALQQLQILLIEEVGVQVQSTFQQQETLDRDAFNRSVQANYQTFARALTRTRILEERWDGESFYVRAEIAVDPAGLGQQMMALQQAASGVDPCTDKRLQVQEWLKKPPSPVKSDALAELAMSTPFNNTCYEWQYTVLRYFAQTRYPVDAYLPYVFSQLQDTSAHDLTDLVPALLSFALSDGSLADSQWNALFAVLPRIEPRAFPLMVRSLTSGTQYERRSRGQTQAALEQQLIALFQLAQAQQLAQPALAYADTLVMTLRTLTQQGFTPLAMQWYSTYHVALTATSTAERVPLLAPFLSHVQANPEQRALRPLFSALLEDLATDVDQVAEQEWRRVYFTMQTWQRQANNDPLYEESLFWLLSQHADLVSRILNTITLNSRDRDEWFIRYQLPNSPACTPAECAQQLFSEEQQVVQTASQLLLSYGKRASSEHAHIVRKLERVAYEQSGSHRTLVKRHLLQLLPQLTPQQVNDVPLLIRYLSDLDHQIPDHAMDALVAMSSVSIVPMATVFAEQPALVQRRMIRAFTRMPRDERIARFLRGVKPLDEPMRFALEDAIAVHQ